MDTWLFQVYQKSPAVSINTGPVSCAKPPLLSAFEACGSLSCIRHGRMLSAAGVLPWCNRQRDS